MASFRHVFHALLANKSRSLISTSDFLPACVNHKAVSLHSVKRVKENVLVANTTRLFPRRSSSAGASDQDTDTPKFQPGTENPNSENKTSSFPGLTDEGSLEPVHKAQAVLRKSAPEDTPAYVRKFNPDEVERLLASMSGDEPISMPDPFEKEYRRCFLCKHNVQIDHKNVRLLSQFVSPYTGRIYGRAITGLCIPMQKRIAQYIKRSRKCGYMPFIIKDPRYLQDPLPYDSYNHKN